MSSVQDRGRESSRPPIPSRSSSLFISNSQTRAGVSAMVSSRTPGGPPLDHQNIGGQPFGFPYDSSPAEALPSRMDPLTSDSRRRRNEATSQLQEASQTDDSDFFSTDPVGSVTIPGIEAEPISPSTRQSMRHQPKAERVKRWDSSILSPPEWDGLRRDPELFIEDGDCQIHLYPKGQSRRGPSFCVPFRTLRERRCGALVGLCSAQPLPNSSMSRRQSLRYSMGTATAGLLDLYVPAPDTYSKAEAFQWHLTTRNFFAFLCDKPLVGAHLGKALVELEDRMTLYRTEDVDNRKELLEYAEAMGYLSMNNSPDYALGMLYYSEGHEVRDLYINAFVHCVGMNNRLCESTEFLSISRVSKALITRAYLEMDLHIGRISKAIKNFLEDELSPAQFGLSNGGRLHLDRFRSFLHSFYVEKYGYWPPPREFTTFPKDLYKSMYFDFRNLYEYLVDEESSDSIQDQPPASGGICVLQNIKAFNNRHKYNSLPHPLPLIPEMPPAFVRTQTSNRALKKFKLQTKHQRSEQILGSRTALLAATNTGNPMVTKASLVRSYIRFESDLAARMDEKVSMADARKVRWILIYCTLQMLASVVRAPPEVHNTNDVQYPLCCLLAGTPPWEGPSRAVIKPALSVSSEDSVPSLTPDDSEISNEPTPDGSPATSPISIHPDCEGMDYFNKSMDTKIETEEGSQEPLPIDMPAPLRVNSQQMMRNSSLRSIKALSLLRRNSTPMKKSIPPVPPTPTRVCELRMQGFFHDDEEEQSKDSPTSRSASPFEHGGQMWSLEEDDDAAKSLGRLRKRPASLALNCAPISEDEGRRSPTLDVGMLDANLVPCDAFVPSSPSDPSSPYTDTWSATVSEVDTEATSAICGTPSIERQNSQRDSYKEPHKFFRSLTHRASASSSIYSLAHEAPAPDVPMHNIRRMKSERSMPGFTIPDYLSEIGEYCDTEEYPSVVEQPQPRRISSLPLAGVGKQVISIFDALSIPQVK